MSQLRAVVGCAAGLLVCLTTASLEAAPACDGPSECCGVVGDQAGKPATTVSVGVAVQGIHNLDEKTGSWDIDYYLYETWRPAPGFTPQTEIVNEIARQESPSFDLVELRRGFCQRSRRLHSTLQVSYDLRRFPFDRQKLLVVVSDAQYSADQLSYAERPSVSDIESEVRSEVSGWRVASEVEYSRNTRRFSGEEGSPPYDYATFSVSVERRAAFHVTKYFLPLFVVVIIGLCVFWIDPQDLNTQVSIGVTCLLAAIALQFAESGNLPAVSYLTLADRVYVACYLTIAVTLVESIYAHSLVRKGDHHTAVQVEKRFRTLIPAALLVAVGMCVWLSFR
jgi:hypothetical protein